MDCTAFDVRSPRLEVSVGPVQVNHLSKLDNIPMVFTTVFRPRSWPC